MNKKITYLIPLVLITACSGYSNNTKDIQSKQTATTNQDYNIKIDDLKPTIKALEEQEEFLKFSRIHMMNKNITLESCNKKDIINIKQELDIFTNNYYAMVTCKTNKTVKNYYLDKKSLVTGGEFLPNDKINISDEKILSSCMDAVAKNLSVKLNFSDYKYSKEKIISNYIYSEFINSKDSKVYYCFLLNDNNSNKVIVSEKI